MKNIFKISIFVLIGLVVCVGVNRYMSYKISQCLDHNAKGFALRFVPADKAERHQTLVNAKVDAVMKSDYSLIFGCRFYEDGKLTKFVYEYPMTDEAFSKDYTSIIEKIDAYKNSHK